MRAISTILGNKPFLFGDQPTEADASLFGWTNNVFYTAQDSCPYRLDMLNEYMNILAHNERMKARFFPDWDKLRTGMVVLPRPVVNVHKWQPRSATSILQVLVK